MKAIGFPFGLSFLFWSLVGLARLISEKFSQKTQKPGRKNLYRPSDIAVIIPAHNEELVISSCINALKKSLKTSQIHVISDGSKDKTFEIAKGQNVNTRELLPGRGKAKAIIYAIRTFKLFKRYKLIFIVDADTKIDRKFIKNALPAFNDTATAVIFGKAAIVWPKHVIPRRKLYFIAYRERLNRVLQYFLIYGMTAKFANVNFVVPGFCALYRSDILKKLKIDTPGLLIEDFNLAFQIHKKRLGLIRYNPACIGWDQHPDNLKDYWNQVRRWNIGFFQTVKANGIFFSFFYISLVIFSVEVFLSAIFTLFLLVLILYLILPNLVLPQTNFLPQTFLNFYQNLGPFKDVTLGDIVLQLYLFDYSSAVLIGLINKKPQFIIYALFFPFMHFVTSLILVSSLIPGFFGKSVGRWTSPTRRAESIRI